MDQRASIGSSTRPVARSCPLSSTEVAQEIANKVAERGHFVIKLYKGSTLCTRCRRRKRCDNRAYWTEHRCERQLKREREEEEEVGGRRARMRRSTFDDPEGEEMMDEDEAGQSIAGGEALGAMESRRLR